MNNLHVKTGDTVILLTGKYEDKFDSARATERPVRSLK